mmetsp:Transcript_17146/g.23560  ORF Transcript_17146/g.23560 Transcript_17146/m.23560 type:complete len:475 (-) Transcript_17146:124-1548(-)
MSGTDEFEVRESVIRKMTRLAIEYKAINLSQGFPNEGPPTEGVCELICGLLGGTDEKHQELRDKKVSELMDALIDSSRKQDTTLSEFLSAINKMGGVDYISQYSMPFGRPALREKIASYYERFYSGQKGATRQRVDPDRTITVTLGATESLAIVLRTICKPGDSVLIMEPFHELYPSQAAVLYLHKEFTELKENITTNKWELDYDDVKAKADKCKAMILCDPHNPTGKVFDVGELQRICRICIEHDMYLITDDIYEHMIYPGAAHDKHILPGWDTESILTADAGFGEDDVEKMANLYIIMNSLSKTWSATGWRCGWVISPQHLTHMIRAVHDQMVLQAATPIQVGAQALLDMPPNYFLGVASKYQERRNFLVSELEKLGFQCTWPNSAYYVFMRYRNVPALKGFDTPLDAATFILKEIGVATVPGDNFYHNGHNTDYIRFCFCRQLPDLKAAIERLQKLNEYDAGSALETFSAL